MVQVPGRKGVKVPETSSEGLSILVVNLSINVYQKDCQACVTDEKEVQYKIAMRLHILGYDVWLEEAIQNDFQIGDVEGSGASKRYDIFVAHGNAKVWMQTTMQAQLPGSPHITFYDAPLPLVAQTYTLQLLAHFPGYMLVLYSVGSLCLSLCAYPHCSVLKCDCAPGSISLLSYSVQTL